jgi:hypothetical protein
VGSGAFDPTAYLDAWFREHPDRQELGRAGWQDGQVGVVLGRTEVSGRPALAVDVVTAVPGEPLNAGGSSQACRDSAITMTGNMTRGYVGIVTTDRVTRASYIDGGVTHDVPLIAAAQPGYRYGFIAEPPLPSGPNQGIGIQVTFFDEAGAEVPCVQ